MATKVIHGEPDSTRAAGKPVAWHALSRTGESNCKDTRRWNRLAGLNGAINDQGAVTECIHWVLREAERTSGLQLNDVVMGVGGPSVRGHNARGHLDFGRPREITQRDVNKVVDRALRVQLPEDRMVLQLCQQDFMVDDHPGHRDPRKMIGTELELNVHLIMASQQEHTSLLTAAHQAHMAGGGDHLRGAGRLPRRGAPAGAARRHRGGGHRRAVHRPGGLLRRRAAACRQPARGRRSLHARRGAWPPHRFRRRRDGEGRVRLRHLRTPPPRPAPWRCRRATIARGARCRGVCSTAFWNPGRWICSS